jgi:lysozyme family protein
LHYLNNNTEKIYPNIIAARKEYVQSLDDYATFGKGWMNRINSFPASIVVAGGAAILLLFAAVFF